MPMVDDDPVVFFNADFVTHWTRLAGADVAAVSFPAIHGVQDAEGLQGYALTADSEITYITGDVDLHEGQLLTQSGSATTWRVRREPLRTGDGMTSTVLIGQAP